MRHKVWSGVVAGVLGGVLIAGAMGATSCDNNNGVAAGGGGTSAGGSGGDAGVNTTAFTMQLSGVNVVPSNPSTATGSVVVMLNRTTGAVMVTGSFNGLSSNATGAAIHGPAGTADNAAVLVPLTVPNTTSGTVSGSGSITGTEMNDMTAGMTYVSISSVNYPDGELRAQIVP